MSIKCPREEIDDAHYTIIVCTRLLREFNDDECADVEDRQIPTTVNNSFVRGGLIQAIRVARDILVKGGAA